VSDLIRDADGSVSKTVRQYVKANGKSAELLAALDEFFEMFRSQRIVTRDILDHNLVIQIGESTRTIYMIDGFGSAELLPISCWFPTIGRKSVERKIARFRARYGLG